jgi:Protein of unknown function (DUF1579)
MTTRTRWMGFVLGTVLLAGAPAWAAEEKKMEMPPEMEAWAKVGTPGEPHKMLEPLVGKWSTTTTMWMNPGQPPMVVEGTAESKWILGGRYVETVHKSSFMGQPFEGRSLDGYDNQTQQYVNTWLDTMSTGPMIAHGKADGKNLAYTSELIDPMSGQKMKSRSVTSWPDKNTFKHEAFMVGPDGKEFKSMEVVGKRQ